MNAGKRYLGVCVFANAPALAGVAFYFFIIPFYLVLGDLRDPGLSSNQTPRFAWRWHEKLTPRFEDWAATRVSSEKAQQLSIDDISGTEWPMFSAVFYLWATEALQDTWEQYGGPGEMPRAYAAGAIAAAAALTADPINATWVKRHWGDDYLEEENIFFRMLLISGLTSYQKLTGSDRYQNLLADQVISLAAELDRSPSGLLDDYPGQCYPVDVLPAISSIRRADGVLGTDHSSFAMQAIRGFDGAALDPTTQLPAYIADSRTGIGIGPARGVGMSYMLIWAPELWPDTASAWYELYAEQFWHDDGVLTGFRELPKHAAAAQWFFDVDAGPVFSGIGTAASAFGIGAARRNGRFDHAYPLSAEALVATWPLPDGSLLGPRLLSNLSDAPLLGEAALLFNFTRQTVAGFPIVERHEMPWIVPLAASLYLLLGLILAGPALMKIRRWLRMQVRVDAFRAPRTQFVIWTILFWAGMVTILTASLSLGLALLFAAQLLPRRFVRRSFTALRSNDS